MPPHRVRKRTNRGGMRNLGPRQASEEERDAAAFDGPPRVQKTPVDGLGLARQGLKENC